MPLAWRGRMEDAFAAWRAGVDEALVLAPDAIVPDFVLEAQAAAMGRALATGAAQPPHATLDDALRAGFRGFVVAAHDAALLGRFVDEEMVAAGAGNGSLRTLVVDGPGFTRRVDVVAGDAREHGGGWRLEVGLRGC